MLCSVGKGREKRRLRAAPFKTANAMKKKLIPLCALCAAAFAAQLKGEDAALLPYGNLGLDYAASQIEGANSGLESQTGVRFFFDYYAVLVGNPYGGVEQGANYTAEMIFGLDFDLEKQVGWTGGAFTISGAYSIGGNLSDKIGNFFTASESYVVNGAAFYEMYFTQTLETRAGTVAVNFGRMSMSDAFADLPVMGYLVSGGMDSTPEAIFYNSPFTSSPQATWGINAQYSPVSEVTLSAGLYQAPQSLGDADWNGTEFGIHSDDGYMALFQAAWSPEFFRQAGEDGKPADGTGLQGLYQIGGYFFGGYDGLTDYSGGTRGNGYGLWIQGQQMVWRDPGAPYRYASVWAGMQYSPVQSVSTMPWMVYGGIQLQGFVPHRSQDGFYFSWLYGSFNSNYGYGKGAASYSATYEMVVEATYVIQLNEHISIQPDMQYIFRPNGNSDLDDALVLGGQLIVSF